MYHARITILIFFVLLGTGILSARLYQLQIRHGGYHRQRAEATRTDLVLLPGWRGSIVDRNGRVLARDEPRFDIEFNYWLFIEPKNALARLAALGERDGFTPAERSTLIEQLKRLAAQRADRSISRRQRFLRTWRARQQPLVRAEIARALDRLAGLLGVPPESLRARLALIEAEIARVLDSPARAADRYRQLVRLGGNPIVWDDWRRKERRERRRRRRAGLPLPAERYPFNPLRLALDVSRTTTETIAELQGLFPGVVAAARTRRAYPAGPRLAHVLGYLREVERIGFTPPPGAEPGDLTASPYFQRLMDAAVRDVGPEFIRANLGSEARFRARFENAVLAVPVGVTGLERYDEQALAGRFGAAVVERDVSGRVQRIIAETPSRRGPTLKLTIDLDLQAACERALQAVYDRLGRPKNRPGAAIVLDALSGEVLAIASVPGFDPGRLMGRTPADRAYQRQLFDAEHPPAGRPLFNRAVHGTPPPGSVFKVVTALAGLQAAAEAAESPASPVASSDGAATATEAPPDRLAWDRPCTGRWDVAYDIWRVRKGFSCHGGRSGHGTLDLPRALEVSCNCYFHDLAYRIGYDRLRQMAATLGIAESTGLDFPELATWRRGRDGSMVNWELPAIATIPADAPLVGIGQGRARVTVVQIARLMAAVATRGFLPVPHLVKPTGSAPAPRILASIPAEHWALVAEGLTRVVNGSEGTARRQSLLRRYKAAGKTGTAQTGRRAEINGRLRDLHAAWFAGYAPYDAEPGERQVAFAVYIEDTFDYGGQTAAWVSGKLLEAVAALPAYAPAFR